MTFWKCKCGVLNNADREECAFCKMPMDQELFDGVSTDDDTRILPVVGKKKESADKNERDPKIR